MYVDTGRPLECRMALYAAHGDLVFELSIEGLSANESATECLTYTQVYTMRIFELECSLCDQRVLHNAFYSYFATEMKIWEFCLFYDFHLQHRTLWGVSSISSYFANEILTESMGHKIGGQNRRIPHWELKIRSAVRGWRRS